VFEHLTRAVGSVGIRRTLSDFRRLRALGEGEDGVTPTPLSWLSNGIGGLGLSRGRCQGNRADLRDERVPPVENISWPHPDGPLRCKLLEFLANMERVPRPLARSFDIIWRISRFREMGISPPLSTDKRPLGVRCMVIIATGEPDLNGMSPVSIWHIMQPRA